MTPKLPTAEGHKIALSVRDAVEQATTAPTPADSPSDHSPDFRAGWLFDHSIPLWGRLLSVAAGSGGTLTTSELNIWDAYLCENGWAPTEAHMANLADPPIGQ